MKLSREGRKLRYKAFELEAQQMEKPKDYRQSFVDKISQETTIFLTSFPWPSAEVGIRSGMQFTKRRIKHYGLNNKYLPPLFKRRVKEDVSNIERPSGETEDAILA